MDAICMNGVGGAAYVTMHKKHEDALEAGMAVTITAANEVRLGVAAGSPVFGIVCGVETDDTVSVQTCGFSDAVAVTATTANRPAIGAVACCNDKGEIVKMDAPPATSRGIITALDAATKTATVLL